MEKKSLIDNPTLLNMVFYQQNIAIPNDFNPNADFIRLNIGNDVEIEGFFYKNDVNNPIIFDLRIRCG